MAFQIESYYLPDDCAAVFEVLEDGSLILRQANELNCQLLGLVYPQCLNSCLRGQLEDALYVRIWQSARRALLQRSPLKYVQRVWDEREQAYWLLNVQPFGDSESLVSFTSSRLDGVCWDSEQLFEQAEARDALMEGSSDAILAIELDSPREYRLTAANRLYLSWFGLSLTDLIGRRGCDVLPPAVVQVIDELVEECLCTLHSVSRHKCVVIDGKEQHVWVTASPLFLREKVTILFFLHDYTQAFQNQQEKDRLLSEYQCFFTSTVNGVALLEVNERGETQCLRSNTSFDIFVNLYNEYRRVQSDHCKLMQMLADGRPCQHRVEICMLGRRSVYYDVSLVPIPDGGGRQKIFISCVNSSEKVRLRAGDTAKLTKREREVLDYVVSGVTNRYIAYGLGIAEGTVKKIVYNAYKKLNISSRNELVRSCLGSEGPWPTGGLEM